MPTRAELQALTGQPLAPLIAPNLKILFCGINPSLYSVYVGHHFARPGNRFWPTLYAAGFTDRLLKPSEEQELLTLGFGITGIVERATATADELSKEELIAGRQRLLAQVEQVQPRIVAILGIGAYRMAFNRPRAMLGRQDEKLGTAYLWVLPNPSGLNAHYTLTDLGRIFGEFHLEVEKLLAD